MIKLLIGGSPCTHWSIAQTKDRETEASGIGWELFRNYLIAKEKWKPDYFLYENNKSASENIKNQIKRELGVTEQNSLFEEDNGVRFTYINSALVSAQNRQRFYVTNFGDIEQPEDRGILLKDVLDSAVTWMDKSHTIDVNYYKGGNMTSPEKQSGKRIMAAEPIGVSKDGKAHVLTTTYWNAVPHDTIEKHRKSLVAEPLQVGAMPRPNGELSTSQAFRVYDVNAKSVTINAGGGGAGGKTGLYAVPIDEVPDMPVKEATAKGYTEIECGDCVDLQHINSKTRRGRNMKDKANSLQTSNDFYQYVGYVIEFDDDGKPIKAIGKDGKKVTIYEVKDGKITIKGKQYPIKLVDGFYIIRKLTVTECMRLQTVPEWYVFPVSNSQAYKMLGNGWTVEVIKHLLSHIPNIENEEIEVLSMYDGMSCGQIALKEMGCNVVKYTAYEIDKYAIETTQHNFPDTIQMGDAFAVRNDNWNI